MRTPRIVLDTLHAVFLARALYVVVEYGIPDLLKERPMSCTDLASTVDASPIPLHQLMRSVATTGLVRTEPGPEVGPDQRFSLTEAGRTLIGGHPSGTKELVLTMQGTTFWNALRALPERVATGRTGPDIVYDRPFFEHLAAHPEEAARFNRMMIATHGDEPAAVARGYDFSRVRTVVDVGGGVGTVLVEILRQHAHLRGLLIDLPDVAQDAKSHLAESDLENRCEIVSGDFLQAVPAGADAYLLSRILHDWDDDTCVRILRTCAAAMTRRSRLLVVEKVLPDNDEPHLGKRLDLVMAALTHGRERTGQEYAELLSQAGLRLNRLVPTESASSVCEATLAG